jgi:5-methylcytosine-specific restriction endonuclease McrA
VFESREPVGESLRLLVTLRANGRCEYCQSPEAYATERFSVEHVRPRAVGGLTRFENLALACQGCNGHKSAKVEAIDPKTGETIRLFNPRADQWEQHFT